MHPFLSIACLFIVALLLTGCETVDDSLKPEEKYHADTLFDKRWNLESRRLDSLCISGQDSVVKKAMDSIYLRRIEEIQRLLGRK